MTTSTPRLTAEIREAFLKYFESQGHRRVASSSLIPANDPTLLFTNAGMNQFKDAFLGLDERDYRRATTAQKCVRAGGKHNDLENVGFTARHHTFFEMLGNFSFGDYFKKDAIHFAWELSTRVLGLPKDRLRVSVYEKDDEAAEIWHRQEGVPYDRIVRFGDADNFWSMGDTGPCGPCSEIFFDQGREVDGDRWLEFWNLVFMQFDRSADGTLKPLPKPSVDTGMGLERMAAILQGAPSNYEIDLMEQLLSETQALVERRTRRKLDRSGWEQSALRVITDHLRSTSFLIADGVLPSNEGRGYVLRRILRRAVRFGKRLGCEEPFLAELFPILENSMSSVYPELSARRSVVTEILTQEESRFFETLDRGLEILEDAFKKVGSSKVVPSEVSFQLYDTYGFPFDLTALIAREKGLTVDESGFNRLMEEQQKRSRGSWKGSGEVAVLESLKEWKSQGIAPRFVGYQSGTTKSQILALAPAGDDAAWVALDPTPFYGEGGGQVGEKGLLVLPNEQSLRVVDTQKPYEGGHVSLVRGPVAQLKVGLKVRAEVDAEERAATRANHTGTHVLHAALRQVLGAHVQQAGSLVTSEKLRFDFSHHKALTAEEIRRVEDWANEVVARGLPVTEELLSYDEAIARGALAFFSEKYGDQVRMIQLPGYSTELCGGLHARNSADLRLVKILSESAVAAGTRRLEAVTRSGAIEWLRGQENLVNSLALRLKTPPAQLEERVEKLLEGQRHLEREMESLRRKLAQGDSSAHKQLATYQGHSMQLHLLEGADAQFLRERADALRQQEPQALHVLVSGKSILVTVSTQNFPTLHAGNILKEICQNLGGRGGGQAQTAQGQVPDALAGAAAVAAILEWTSKS